MRKVDIFQSGQKAAKYELIDKDGNRHGPFKATALAMGYVAFHWPDQKQDEDRTGEGWDIQVTGCDR